MQKLLLSLAAALAAWALYKLAQYILAPDVKLEMNTWKKGKTK